LIKISPTLSAALAAKTGLVLCTKMLTKFVRSVCTTTADRQAEFRHNDLLVVFFGLSVILPPPLTSALVSLKQAGKILYLDCFFHSKYRANSV
jgi:hypothetical protein